MKRKEKEVKSRIPITVDIFQAIRNMLLSDNNNIQMKDINQIKKFISILDFEKYTGIIVENIPASDYLVIMDRLADACLSKNQTVKNVVIQQMLNESKFKDRFEIIYANRSETSNAELSYLREFMAAHINAAFIFSNGDEMSELLVKMQTGDYECVDELVESYKEFIDTSYAELKSNRVKGEDEKLDSGLDDDSLLNLLSETIKEVSVKGYYLSTGLKNLDEAMGGGLPRGTLTLFGAKTAGFKSGLMLNLLMSLKLYSKGVETFDKTKKPCAVLLSMENTQVETCKRALAYSLNLTVGEIRNSEAHELRDKFKESLDVKTASKDFEVKFLYKKSNSVNINDIRSIIASIEDDGFEVVALFVDYLNTMNSLKFNTSNQETVTLAISDNARELYNLAIEKKIAVVSGYQLNRGAYNNSDDVQGKDKLAFTGGSLNLTTHANNIFIIEKSKVPLILPNGEMINESYIRFDEAKKRSNEDSDKGFFYEVFKRDNKFRLQHSLHESYDFNYLSSAINMEIERKKAEKANNAAGAYNRRPGFNGNQWNQNQHYKSNIYQQGVLS